MRLGIIGLPQAGKTTVFNALTRGNAPTGTMMGGGRFEVHTAVVPVPDPRVDRLSEMFHPRKTIFAQVTYSDIAGLEAESGKKGELSGPLLAELRQVDGLLLVIRVFENASLPHPLGRVDPKRDFSTMQAELVLNDQITVERRLGRLQDELRKGGVKDRAQAQREVDLFTRLDGALQKEQPLRALDFTPEEARLLAGYGLLSQKPMLIVWNLGEGQKPLEGLSCGPHTAQVSLQGKIEMEIAQLAPEEAQVFLAEYGITEPSLNRVIRLSYALLGRQSFFTVGEDEVRAWTVRQGATAPEAAGEVHTDMQKGFIRAEVTSYDDLAGLGGMAEARAKGKLRLEGKDYIVRDGDVITIRFNV